MGYKILCYSVRLKTLTEISPKASKAIGYDGSSAIIPNSQIFGRNNNVNKSQAYWISAWILDKKELTYSHKVKAYFNSNGKRLPNITITEYSPKKVTIDNIDLPEDLLR
ncbi:MAG: hypothetical protein WCS34_09385 [Bacteroidales bacterium]